MKSQIPYWQKLQDPRWQRKRLEIFQRDNFQCVNSMCHLSTHPENDRLEVHHRYYVSKRDPWDYPNSAYVTLCKTCHEKVKPDVDQIVEYYDSFQLVYLSRILSETSKSSIEQILKLNKAEDFCGIWTTIASALNLGLLTPDLLASIEAKIEIVIEAELKARGIV